MITGNKQSSLECKSSNNLFCKYTQSASQSLSVQVLPPDTAALTDLTKLYKTLEILCCNSTSWRIFFVKVTFCTNPQMWRSRCDYPVLNLPGS